MSANTKHDIYEFHNRNHNDNVVALERFKGKVILIVNTENKEIAECITPELQVIQRNYENKPFQILTFPCRRFFWETKHFDQEEKDLLTWLKEQSNQVVATETAADNGKMYLIDTDGTTVTYIAPDTSFPVIESIIDQHVKTVESI